MTSIDRTTYPRFARRLSEEELEKRYDLTPAKRFRSRPLAGRSPPPSRIVSAISDCDGRASALPWRRAGRWFHAERNHVGVVELLVTNRR